MSEPLLEVRHLKKYFTTPKGLLHAVDDVSFTIEEGKTLGLVGESGCGKSTTGRVILRLHEATGGEVLYRGRNILDLSPREMREMRRKMQIVFQDPYSSLNPRMSVKSLIEESLRQRSRGMSSAEREQKVLGRFSQGNVPRAVRDIPLSSQAETDSAAFSRSGYLRTTSPPQRSQTPSTTSSFARPTLQLVHQLMGMVVL